VYAFLVTIDPIKAILRHHSSNAVWFTCVALLNSHYRALHCSFSFCSVSTRVFRTELLKGKLNSHLHDQRETVPQEMKLCIPDARQTGKHTFCDGKICLYLLEYSRDLEVEKKIIILIPYSSLCFDSALHFHNGMSLA